MNNKENKVGIHFLSLGVGGPPTHARPGLVVFRSRDTPDGDGAPRASPAKAAEQRTEEAAAPRLFSGRLLQLAR